MHFYQLIYRLTYLHKYCEKKTIKKKCDFVTVTLTWFHSTICAASEAWPHCSLTTMTLTHHSGVRGITDHHSHRLITPMPQPVKESGPHQTDPKLQVSDIYPSQMVLMSSRIIPNIPGCPTDTSWPVSHCKILCQHKASMRVRHACTGHRASASPVPWISGNPAFKHPCFSRGPTQVHSRHSPQIINSLFTWEIQHPVNPTHDVTIHMYTNIKNIYQCL